MFNLISHHGSGNETYCEIPSNLSQNGCSQENMTTSIYDGKPYSLLLGVKTIVASNVISQKGKNSTPL